MIVLQINLFPLDTKRPLPYSSDRDVHRFAVGYAFFSAKVSV